MQVEQLIIFVKAPRLGEVKTRLAKTIGPEAARAAYCRLVDVLLGNLSNLDNVQLRVSPDQGRLEIGHWLRGNWSVRPQGEGDLGLRMENAFAESFREGVRRVVVIGSDCPGVGTQDIERSWAKLASSDVVLGPALDGGYWLIGLNKPRPILFKDICWSTPHVLNETLDRARHNSLEVALLDERGDVDTEADWNRFLSGEL
jgi:rSAM/selenodomain-associated transferase 1